MVFLFYLTTALAAAFITLYFYLKNKYTYWEKLGVPFLEPKFGLGNMDTGKSKSLWIKDIYDKLKGKAPIAGIYVMFKPVAIITDLDLVRDVLIKDFSHFVNRGVYHNEEADPASLILSNIEDEKWKTLRQKMTPAFSSGKMKFMFPTILKVADKLQVLLMKFAATDGRCELRETFNLFTTDVISTCAFGLEVNCLENPDSEFRKHGRGVGRISQIKGLILDLHPEIAKFLKLRVFPKEHTEYITGVVFETIRHRLKNNVERSDFLQLLLNLREKDAKDGKESILTDTVLSGQALIFLVAGFDTSAIASSFAVYHLAKDQKLQDKVRKEINEVFHKHNGEFTYEAMMEMKYLDQVFNESLRMHTPVSHLRRMCNKDYKIPGTDIVIEKGTRIFVPAHGIHRDPELYPNPDVFNPDNFSPENIEKRHPMSFLAFGEGPRNCIALRFGQLQGRIGLATVVKNFRFSACPDTPKNIVEYDVKTFATTSKLPLIVKVEKI